MEIPLIIAFFIVKLMLSFFFFSAMCLGKKIPQLRVILTQSLRFPWDSPAPYFASILSPPLEGKSPMTPCLQSQQTFLNPLPCSPGSIWPTDLLLLLKMLPSASLWTPYSHFSFCFSCHSFLLATVSFSFSSWSWHFRRPHDYPCAFFPTWF